MADGNTQGTLKEVAWHELTHAALDTEGDTFIRPAQKEKLFKSLDAQVKLAKNAKGDSPLKRAIRRVEQAETKPENYLEEVTRYLMTEYVADPNSFTGKIVSGFKILSVRFKLLCCVMLAGRLALN